MAFSTFAGAWTIPVAEDVWSAVAITYNKSATGNDPAARVNFAAVTATKTQTPSGAPQTPSSGYCVGNWSDQGAAFDGRIAHMQIFNRMLSAAEMDAAVKTPGSIKQSLRLWLPMLNASDVNDRSGNDFHGTATSVTTGSDGPAVNSQQDIPSGIEMLPAGRTTVAQHIIPSYANRTSYPAGQLRGWGPASVIQANASTGALPSAKRAVVITQYYDGYPGFQQRTEPTWEMHTVDPAVLRPVIRDLTIIGHDETATDYADQGVCDSQPGLWNVASGEITGATNASPIVITTTAQSPNTGQRVTVSGVLGNTNANGSWPVERINNTTFKLLGSSGNNNYINGTGSINTASAANPIVITTSSAHGLSTDHIVTIAGNSKANANGTFKITVTGMDTFTIPVDGTSGGSGSTWTNIDSWTCEDLYDLCLVRASGPQIENVNFYYCPGTMLKVNSPVGERNGQFGPWDSEKTRVWNCKFRRGYRGLEVDLIDAEIGCIEMEGLRDYGIKFTAGATQIRGNIHIYGIAGPCMWFDWQAGNCWGSGPFYVENAPVGMQIDNSHNVLSNIHSHSCWLQNIYLAGWNNRLSDLDLLVYYGGAGTATGVYFRGFHNTISKGKIRLANSANDGIFLHATDGAHVGARIDNIFIEGPASGQGTGIRTNGTLNGCYIRVQLKQLNIGVDLFDGSNNRIGARNTIIVTTDDASDVTTPINLPTGWQSATPKNTTNNIWSNGTRWYPANDEF